ncbi:hypothetical protein SLEP1_g58391 [Rubroshorea leprosula]|uniref:Uncharacterized protein n=1 Tax=Rubroshorea leprosula TaxID=152421 RepID=A0AAV5MP97_9ROSI|nr:hypothetical protein SLEP1_g58391 [Rubroshorea leprosula]
MWSQISTMINIPFVDSWPDLLHWMRKRVRRKSLLSILIKLSWNATNLQHLNGKKQKISSAALQK